jgi:hypothetical protein
MHELRDFLFVELFYFFIRAVEMLHVDALGVEALDGVGSSFRWPNATPPQAASQPYSAVSIRAATVRARL